MGLMGGLADWRCTMLMAVFLAARASGFNDSYSEQVTSLTTFSCDPRPHTDVCNFDNMGGVGIRSLYRGTELNDGQITKTASNQECCRKCQETPGCKGWSRFRADDTHNSQSDCWLKSSISYPATYAPLVSGVVGPVLANPMPCNALDMIGFREAVPYNNPKQLHTTSPKACCDWCQADNELCFGWSWSAFDEYCKLYGTPIPENDHYICRDCVSGKRRADRDTIKSIKKCSSGGQVDTHYQGSKTRVVIAQKNAFKTRTSNECCGICEFSRECKSWSWGRDYICYINGNIPEPQFDSRYRGGIASIKVCNPEPCDVVRQISIHDFNLYINNPLAPVGDSLVVSSPEECCQRCQEYPECALWTSVQIGVHHSLSECRMKARVPPEETFKTAIEVVKDRKIVVTGYVKSRVASLEIEAFMEGIRFARNEASVGEQTHSKSGPSLCLIVSIVGIAGIMVCLVFFALMAYRQGSIKKDLDSKTRESSGTVIKTIPLYDTPKQAFESIRTTTRNQVLSTGAVRSDLSVSTKGIDQLAPTYQPEEPMPEISKRLKEIKENFLTKQRSFKGVPLTRQMSEQYSIPIEVPVGAIVAGKYIIEPGYRLGENSHVLNATQKFGHGRPVVLKFYLNDSAFITEKKFFSQRLATTDFIPQVFDVFDADTVETWGLPRMSCIVIERGEQTLAQWLGRCTRTLDTMDQRSMLHKICCAVQSLHDCGIVHRDLKPDNIVLFSSSFTWKLIDFGSWGKLNEKEAIQYSLHYAPPEMILAHASNENSITAKTSSDMWSLGLIFWEILTGDTLFDMNYTETQVLSALMGAELLPFEKEPKMWAKIEEASARRLVAHLLQRNPGARWTIQKVISNAYFSHGMDTIQIKNSNERVTGMLSSIAESIQRVEGRAQQAAEIAFENLKHTVGAVLLMCFSFYEVAEVADRPINPAMCNNADLLALSDERIIKGYIEGTVPCTKALLEPSYNVFNCDSNDPVSLLRLGKKHLLKITIMYGADVMMELPISEILFCRLFPSEAEEDFQEIKMFPYFEGSQAETTARHSIGVWDTQQHEDLALKIVGKVPMDIVVGFRLLGSGSVVQVRKSLEISMFPPNEPFRLAKMFYRTQEWYSKLPNWAKLYIHGAVTVFKLS